MTGRRFGRPERNGGSLDFFPGESPVREPSGLGSRLGRLQPEARRGMIASGGWHPIVALRKEGECGIDFVAVQERAGTLLAAWVAVGPPDDDPEDARVLAAAERRLSHEHARR